MKHAESTIEKFVFFSRWLQLPMYLGLIVGSVLYCAVFLVKLWNIMLGVWNSFSGTATHAAGHAAANHGHDLSEVVLLGVLGLVDMLMVANLVVMVIIGGYSTFVSRLDIDEHADRPDWLQHVNAGTLKVKLAASLATVSGIHLLQSFVEIGHSGLSKGEDGSYLTFFHQPVLWQIVIHVVFLISTLLLAYADKVMNAAGGHSAPATDSGH